jgi:hypothetical protein
MTQNSQAFQLVWEKSCQPWEILQILSIVSLGAQYDAGLRP